jgi:RNA polymerase sigma factor (TIGR02999 family)
MSGDVSETPLITGLLREAAGGSLQATDHLLSVLYDELRRVAGNIIRGEAPGRTLQTTELVHEAYLRLVGQTRGDWNDRTHFLATASLAMRRVLVDHARRRLTQRRGGNLKKLSLDEALVIGTEESDIVLLALEHALGKLAARHPEAARVVEMRYFGGLSHDECAQVMGFSPRTASRHWEFAQAWLYREMNAQDVPT